MNGNKKDGNMADRGDVKQTYLSLADLYPPDRFGGSERVIHELSTALIHAGYKTGIMAGGSKRQEPCAGCIPPIWRFPVTPAPLPVLLMSIYEYYRRLSELPVAEDGTILIHHRLSGWAAHRTDHLKNRPSISFFYGPIDEEWITQWKGSKKTAPRVIASPLVQTMMPPLLKSIQKTALNASNAVVTLGEYTKEQAREIIGDKYPPVYVIRPGVDHARFTPAADKRAAKEEIGLNPSDTVLLSVRRLVPRMGLESLMAMFRILLDHDPSIHLVIVGSGSMMEWLQDYLKGNQLTESVHIAGYVAEDHLPDYYRAADLFVLPSIDLEGFGLVTLEAMACGVPVVATGIGETVYLLREADAFSRIVPPDDPQNLARACLELLPVSRETAQMCVSFSKRFSWSEMAKAVHELADSLP